MAAADAAGVDSFSQLLARLDLRRAAAFWDGTFGPLRGLLWTASVHIYLAAILLCAFVVELWVRSEKSERRRGEQAAAEAEGGDVCPAPGVAHEDAGPVEACEADDSTEVDENELADALALAGAAAKADRGSLSEGSDATAAVLKAERTEDVSSEASSPTAIGQLEHIEHMDLDHDPLPSPRLAPLERRFSVDAAPRSPGSPRWMVPSSPRLAASKPADLSASARASSATLSDEAAGTASLPPMPATPDRNFFAKAFSSGRIRAMSVDNPWKSPSAEELESAIGLAPLKHLASFDEPGSPTPRRSADPSPKFPQRARTLSEIPGRGLQPASPFTAGLASPVRASTGGFVRMTPSPLRSSPLAALAREWSEKAAGRNASPP